MRLSIQLFFRNPEGRPLFNGIFLLGSTDGLGEFVKLLESCGEISSKKVNFNLITIARTVRVFTAKC